MAARPVPLLLAAALAAALPAAPAGAYSDSRVEALITPDFGALLKPPVQPAYGRRSQWRHRPPPPPKPGPPGPPRGPLVPFTAVDCGDPKAGPQPINAALARLQPGGVLYLRGGAACRETIDAFRPVTIVGEGASAFDPGPAAPPTIYAPPGQPCLAVSGGARVEVRDVRLVSETGTGEACVDVRQGEAALVRVDVRYAGDDAAVLVSGGRLVLHDGRIDAPQASAGIAVQDAVVDLKGLELRTGAIGLDLALDGRAASRVAGLRLIGPGPATRLRTTGVLVRGGRSPGRLIMTDGEIAGWSTGLWVDIGASAELSNAWVHRTRVGVIVEDADLAVTGSRIGARDTAVYVAAGRPTIDGNLLYGFTGQPVTLAAGAQYVGRNQTAPRSGCAPEPSRRRGRAAAPPAAPAPGPGFGAGPGPGPGSSPGAGPDSPSCTPWDRLAPDLRTDDEGWYVPAPAPGRPPRR